MGDPTWEELGNNNGEWDVVPDGLCHKLKRKIGLTSRTCSIGLLYISLRNAVCELGCEHEEASP